MCDFGVFLQLGSMEREKLINQLMAGKLAAFAADNGEAGFY